MSERIAAWPNGKRVAVAVTVMFEAWSDGGAPNYSVQTSHLKPGTVDHASAAWATYGGRVGVWRILRTLDRLSVPATFFANARCAELYPDAVRQIAAAGHDIGGHGYTQDGLLAYLDAEGQRATIRRSLDLLQSVSGKRPTGWISPVLAFTPETAGYLAEAGLAWHGDVTYTDLPYMMQTEHGPIAGVPSSDFTDNRTLRSSPHDLLDVYCDTFDYLYRHEPMSMLVMTLHCHFGGRPMIIAAFEQIVAHLRKHPDVWWARHEELAAWASNAPASSYRSRFFVS